MVTLKAVIVAIVGLSMYGYCGNTGCSGNGSISQHRIQCVRLTCLSWLRDSIQDYSRNGPFTATLLHAANWTCSIHCSLGHHNWPPRLDCSS